MKMVVTVQSVHFLWRGCAASLCWLQCFGHADATCCKNKRMDEGAARTAGLRKSGCGQILPGSKFHAEHGLPRAEVLAA
jgi:hypothetical protein